eukprot:9485787-Pyramimonas_sp.AAC.1
MRAQRRRDERMRSISYDLSTVRSARGGGGGGGEGGGGGGGGEGRWRRAESYDSVRRHPPSLRSVRARPRSAGIYKLGACA